MNEDYVAGFMAKAAELGVDPQELAKAAWDTVSGSSGYTKAVYAGPGIQSAAGRRRMLETHAATREGSKRNRGIHRNDPFFKRMSRIAGGSGLYEGSKKKWREILKSRQGNGGLKGGLLDPEQYG